MSEQRATGGVLPGYTGDTVTVTVYDHGTHHSLTTLDDCREGRCNRIITRYELTRLLDGCPIPQRMRGALGGPHPLENPGRPG